MLFWAAIIFFCFVLYSGNSFLEYLDSDFEDSKSSEEDQPEMDDD